MKKNNISFILSALLLISAQINICSESAGWFSYIPTLQSAKRYAEQAVGTIAGYIGNIPQFVSSLSDRTKIALFAALAGALGFYVIYNKYGKIEKVEKKEEASEEEIKQEIKQIEQMVQQRMNQEKLDPFTAQNRRAIAAKKRQPAPPVIPEIEQNPL